MQFIPQVYIKDNIESYLADYTSNSQKIYIVTLTILFALIIFSPFINIDISIQEDGVISNDSALFADIRISPQNLCYMYAGMPVKIQVKTFNYYEWGMVKGKISEIPMDYPEEHSENDMFYKVKCSIEEGYLEDKNGKRTSLKKGMKVRAHFVVTKRSLLSLLNQKLNENFNPTQHSIN